jgi:hypothetical protein
MALSALVLSAALAACGGDTEPTTAGTDAVEDASEQQVIDGLVIDPGYWIPGYIAPAIPVPGASPSDEDGENGEDGGAPEVVLPTPIATRDPIAEACLALIGSWTSANQALLGISVDHPRQTVNAFATAGLAMEGARPLARIAAPWQDWIDYLATVNAALAEVSPDDAGAVTQALAGAVTTYDTQAVMSAADEISGFLSDGCVVQ